MEISKILTLARFFKAIKIEEEDVTTDAERAEGQLTVVVTYTYEQESYRTKPLYYRDITRQHSIKNLEIMQAYFGSPVYWLDINMHDWPQSEGAELERTVIDDMVNEGDDRCAAFLRQLANNQQTGFIQQITSEGSPLRYGHNLENNNHWHDIVRLIQTVINAGGEEVNKAYFSRLVYRWQDNERVSLSKQFGYRKIVDDLQKNIKLVHNQLHTMEYINLLQKKPQIILQGPPGTGKTRAAKEIAFQLIFNRPLSTDKDKREEDLRELSASACFKLIQFHPAYSYEDFVRGITAQTNGTVIEYQTGNRIFAKFAQEALKNYNDSRKDLKELSEESTVEELFELFKEHVQGEIDVKGQYDINETVFINEVELDAFRYTGINWISSKAGLRMKFSDLLTLHRQNATNGKAIKKMAGNISGSAWQHAYYYAPVVEKFRAYIKDKKVDSSPVEKVPEQNYVFIIDEINRANLPAVLGELIYGLEYRGKPVTSMYAIDDDNNIILPPNLYIIGTMNTADRSVGHIDYAIRRRFAFVEVLPRTLPEMSAKGRQLFLNIAALFCKEFREGDPDPQNADYLAPDFKPLDVMPGHSYFIADNDEELSIKLQYEIKPLLREYLKDGILLNGAKEIIKSLNV